jgi:perosamine synthetase
MNKKIFLHEPNFFGNEVKYLNNCIKTGWVSTSGSYVTKFEDEICNFTKSKFALALNSGTSSLDLAIKILGIEKKTEIIVPTLTFVATINSVLYNDCYPLFMDTDNFLNIDIKKIIDFLNYKTFKKGKYLYNFKTKKKISAIILVHVFGNPINFIKLKNFCKKNNIKIIEDASESLGSYFVINKKEIHTGTLGDIGCLSFNANKIITTGAGGAILTNNKKYYKKGLYLSTQAKNDPVYFLHNNLGYNLKLNSICAAVGLAQIEKLKTILDKKKFIYNYYLQKLKKNKFFKILEIDSVNQKSNHWINLLKLNFRVSEVEMKKIIQFFIKNNIEARPVWYPNHLQKYLKQNYKFKLSNFKKYKNFICLPSGANLKKKDLDYVINLIQKLENDFN